MFIDQSDFENRALPLFFQRSESTDQRHNDSYPPIRLDVICGNQASAMKDRGYLAVALRHITFLIQLKRKKKRKNTLKSDSLSRKKHLMYNFFGWIRIKVDSFNLLRISDFHDTIQNIDLALSVA